jgi:UDP-N-acetylglucosamine 2-epimerase (non-hydrolysing)
VKRLLLVFGTRPEAIKVAPLAIALRQVGWCETTIAVTGQHREMLDQAMDLFGLKADYDLNLHFPGQSLTEITARALTGLAPVMETVKPDAVVVQGDTSTTFAAALSAFYHQIPVVHIEAGLRTNDPLSPFPEEINRRLTTQLSTLHLAATPSNAQNLIKEGVDPKRISVTGNTVIDALRWVVDRDPAYGNEKLESISASAKRVLLVTAHRRESWGEGMRQIGEALRQIALRYPNLEVVFPIHKNPIVRDAINPWLAGLPNVSVLEPLGYGPFSRILNRATIVLTDSGGVQEEAPSLGKPVLVMRDTTERPEAVFAGTARLVGTNSKAIVDSVSLLLDDEVVFSQMANAMNPFGDGLACERTIGAIAHFFGLGDRPLDFGGRYEV